MCCWLLKIYIQYIYGLNRFGPVWVGYTHIHTYPLFSVNLVCVCVYEDVDQSSDERMGKAWNFIEHKNGELAAGYFNMLLAMALDRGKKYKFPVKLWIFFFANYSGIHIILIQDVNSHIETFYEMMNSFCVRKPGCHGDGCWGEKRLRVFVPQNVKIFGIIGRVLLWTVLISGNAILPLCGTS
jgi:hypothetical protein